MLTNDLFKDIKKMVKKEQKIWEETLKNVYIENAQKLINESNHKFSNHYAE